jgi:RNA polymerase sigma factor (sigma-70 family)
LLWAALQQLPYRQRAALVLRFYGDLSERDAAAVLGCRTGTVKSLVHRGLAAMREELGVREHE